MKKIMNGLPVEFRCNLPIVELTGNRRATIEGSTGVLKYGADNIRINTSSMVIAFSGRGLRLRCISATSVVVEGFIGQIEFLT
ncbi:MAG: YabP/YqfC family sporulation protein [Ruminococcus sp.]|nr:YabP/YqfC family sporulation protein [Ruminococcus sp.]